jgi:FkbM family methyltransferase
MSLRVRRLADRLRRLVGREDFRRNPLKALWRRLVWRIRWKFDDKPWVLRLRPDLRIAVCRDGQGALLYYQGFAEPETEDYLARFLQPGMVFFDVGAHVGTYTLLAARAVGTQGEVHAFEPNPAVFSLLEKNVRINSLRNVLLQQTAVSDQEGEREFEICREYTVSSLTTGADRFPASRAGRDIRCVVRVRCTALDAYCSARGKRPDLVKIDAEGAEFLVLRGAPELLRLPAAEAPAWVFEYSTANYARFGYGADELLGLLRQCGYEVWRYQGLGRIVPFQPALAELRTMNLFAVKAGQGLPS